MRMDWKRNEIVWRKLDQQTCNKSTKKVSGKLVPAVAEENIHDKYHLSMHKHNPPEPFAMPKYIPNTYEMPSMRWGSTPEHPYIAPWRVS